MCSAAVSSTVLVSYSVGDKTVMVKALHRADCLKASQLERSTVAELTAPIQYSAGELMITKRFLMRRVAVLIRCQQGFLIAVVSLMEN